MVQTEQKLRSKKNQSYLISSTSREKEDSEKTFFTDKEKFQVFRKVTILVISILKLD